jgi:c-di-GMP-binding flagellar brake protein YcgR
MPRLPVSLPLEGQIGDLTFRGQTVNLSMTGCFALIDEDVPELGEGSCRFALAVPTEDGSLEEFTLMMDVIVVRMETRDGSPAAALMFKHVPMEAEWALGKFLLSRFQHLLTTIAAAE